jgi:dTMP kinase
MNGSRGETERASNERARSRKKATLIAIEGIDGSGKGTQTRILVERLGRSGHKVELISFPRYDETFFGRLISSFLNGEYGTLDQVHPMLVSLLFAGDRLESRPKIEQALATCDVVVLDRYVASNVAHQGAKLSDADRETLCRAIEHVEYTLHGMPRPDQVILLDLRVPVAQSLVSKKATRNYTDRAADIQEADAVYLERVRQLYLELARRESNWSIVECEGTQGLRSVDEIAQDIRQVVDRAIR